jgi:hypothetical protein
MLAEPGSADPVLAASGFASAGLTCPHKTKPGIIWKAPEINEEFFR